MNTFGIQNNFSQVNFEEVSIDDLEVISGGSGLGFQQGAVALMGLGAATAGFGVGVLAFSIGATMLAGSTIAGYYYG